MSKLKSYLIEGGNSYKGSIGFSIRVKAHSKREALDKVQEDLPRELTGLHTQCGMGSDVEYLNVYFNAGALKVKDICDGDTESA